VPEDLVLYALILVAVGVVSGFAAGLFGIGGASFRYSPASNLGRFR